MAEGLGRGEEARQTHDEDAVPEAPVPVAEAAASGSNHDSFEQMEDRKDGLGEGAASPRASCQEAPIDVQSAANDFVEVKKTETREQHLPGRLLTESEAATGHGSECAPASAWISAAAVSPSSDKDLPCDFVAIPQRLGGDDDISLEMLDAAAAAGSLPEFCTCQIYPRMDAAENAFVAPDIPVPRCHAGSRPVGIATNGSFICYVHPLGTAVQAVYQPSMSLAASLESGGTKVSDFDLQTEGSHLLTAFDDGRVVVSQLSAEGAARLVLLQFQSSSVRGVRWHPVNPRVFLTVHAERILLWHLQLIVQFSTTRLPGYEPLDEVGVQISLQVNTAIIESAACEALPMLPSAGSGPHIGLEKLDLEEKLLHGATTSSSLERLDTTKGDSPLSSTVISSDGQYLVASTQCILWVWRLRAKDDQTAPTATCVQQLALPECLGNGIVHMRLVPRFASADTTVYTLMAVAGQEVLFWTLDPRPSGGTGCWLPYGKLLCALQQRMRFPCPVKVDVVQSSSAGECPVAKLVVALETHAGLRILSGNLTGGEDVCVVPLLTASAASHETAAREHWSLVAMRGLDRPAQARLLPDGAEAHAWAVITLIGRHGGDAIRCQCITMPQVQTSRRPATEAIEPTDLVVQAATDTAASDSLVCSVSSVAQDTADAALAAANVEPVKHAPACKSLESQKDIAGVDAYGGSGKPQLPRQQSSDHHGDTSKVRHNPGASEMGDSGTAKTIIGHGARRPKKMDAKDTDPLTPEMIRHLAHFMNKKSLATNAKIIESVSRKLPKIMVGNPAGVGRRRPMADIREEMVCEHRTHDMLRNVTREGMQVIDQISRSEKAMVLSLKKACDPELLKQGQSNRQLKEAIERELSRWRDSTLSKVVLKAAESRAFADRFADSLQAGHPESAPLLEVLQPPKQQLQEALQADLVLWCGGAVTRRLRGLFQDTGFSQATRSIQLAMKETCAQAQSMLDRTLQETLTTVDAQVLSSLCAQQVVMAVRQEVERWEAGFGCRHQPLPPRPASASFAVHDDFLRHLRDMVAPLHQDLNDAAHLLESATMEVTEAVMTAETDSMGHVELGACQGMLLSRKLDEVYAALDAGRVQEAFDEALAWDTMYRGAENSLVELACDYLRRQETSPRPDDLLEVPGCLKLHLSHILLQRSILEMAALEQIEANVDLALALLQAVHLDTEEEEQRVVAAFNAVEEEMAEALDQLRRGEWPPNLAEAEPAPKRRIATTARMAVKGLSVFKHARGS